MWLRALVARLRQAEPSARNKAGMYRVFVVPAALDIPVEQAMHKAGCCNKTDTNHRLALPRRRHY